MTEAAICDRKEISIIIPVYEADGCIDVLAQRLHKVLGEMGQTYEIVMVDDGSSDHSWVKICELAKQDKRVIGLRLSLNFGQHYAISADLDVSKGSWVVVMDCDLQDPPELLPALYEKALSGVPIVFAR